MVNYLRSSDSLAMGYSQSQFAVTHSPLRIRLDPLFCLGTILGLNILKELEVLIGPFVNKLVEVPCGTPALGAVDPPPPFPRPTCILLLPLATCLWSVNWFWIHIQGANARQPGRGCDLYAVPALNGPYPNASSVFVSCSFDSGPEGLQSYDLLNLGTRTNVK
ncbi:hypothetical protein RSOLAG1IB_11136 [Rhizoctonia solani AG-1 IB]|uniref:Uncharacterized protein n=1 Tax=Thanatephorus cucumeris (strain AG1-IB / isolate 7/3/14) TaxID=1108050 RepID=A0A0B7F972_THACB|nr:hypothetical protein RSOLAG1IB_11136 [Rhizoctonia solani AG-1 IB]